MTAQAREYLALMEKANVATNLPELRRIQHGTRSLIPHISGDGIREILRAEWEGGLNAQNRPVRSE